jgi:hypothetical protein
LTEAQALPLPLLPKVPFQVTGHRFSSSKLADVFGLLQSQTLETRTQATEGPVVLFGQVVARKVMAEFVNLTR